MERKLLLKPTDVARALKCSRREVYSMIRQGRIVARRRVLRGRSRRPRYLIEESELARFILAMAPTDLNPRATVAVDVGTEDKSAEAAAVIPDYV